MVQARTGEARHPNCSGDGFRDGTGRESEASVARILDRPNSQQMNQVLCRSERADAEYDVHRITGRVEEFADALPPILKPVAHYVLSAGKLRSVDRGKGVENWRLQRREIPPADAGWGGRPLPLLPA